MLCRKTLLDEGRRDEENNILSGYTYSLRLDFYNTTLEQEENVSPQTEPEVHVWVSVLDVIVAYE